MGADMSTDRLRRLQEMGFSVADSRVALEATNGDVDKAAELLTRRRQAEEAAQGGPLARQLNILLREQRPWDEFFARFLWPEHLRDRIQTNLYYYRGNYAIINAGVIGLSVLLRPSLLFVSGLVSCIFATAITWGDQTVVPGINQRLNFEQRVTAASLVAALVVNQSGQVSPILRICLLCVGMTLGHATFRARNLAARWTWFKESID